MTILAIDPPETLQEYEDAIHKSLKILQNAGIDARLSEIWKGGERRLVVVLVNVHELNYLEGEKI